MRDGRGELVALLEGVQVGIDYVTHKKGMKRL